MCSPTSPPPTRRSRPGQDVVDYAKKNPGKVTYGSSGTGGSPHLGTEQVAEKDGIKLTHVPFKGAAELHAAVAGGHVMVGAGGASSKQIVDAGKARFLNVWTAKRQKSFPDVPTLQELGYPVRDRFAVRHRRPQGHGPEGRRRSCTMRSRRRSRIRTVIEVLDRFEMVPNYKNSADYKLAVDEQIKLERALLERIGLLEEVSDREQSPTSERGAHLKRRSQTRKDVSNQQTLPA